MPDHALKHAHEAGDQSVDVAGIVDARRLEHHQRAKEGARWGLSVLFVASQTLVNNLHQ